MLHLEGLRAPIRPDRNNRFVLVEVCWRWIETARVLWRDVGYGPGSACFLSLSTIQSTAIDFLSCLGIQIVGIDTCLGLLNCHSLGKLDTYNPVNT